MTITKKNSSFSLTADNGAGYSVSEETARKIVQGRLNELLHNICEFFSGEGMRITPGELQHLLKEALQ